MIYPTPLYQPDYPEDNAETDVQPLPYCKRCGTVLDFEDAACNCDLF